MIDTQSQYMTHQQKLEKARTKCVLRHPFYAFFALNSMIEVASATPEGYPVKTATTDGHTIYFNPDFLDKLSVPETTFVLAHEAAHIAGGHHLRAAQLESRDPDGYNHILFNIGADYIINAALKSEGHILPPMAALNSEVTPDSHTVEKIYRELLDNADEPPECLLLFGGPPDPDDEDDDEIDEDKEGDQSQTGDSDEEPDEDDEPDSDPGDPGDEQSDDDPAGDGSDSDDSGSDDSDDNQSGDGDSSGSGDGDGSDGDSGQENEAPLDTFEGDMGQILPARNEDGTKKTQAELERDLQDHSVEVRKAATSAKAQGRGSAFGDKVIQEITPATIDWRSALRDFIGNILIGDDFSWSRTDRRFGAEDFALPALGRPGLSELVMAVDTSGSIDDNAFRMFSSEVNSLLEEFPTCRATLLGFTTVVTNEEEVMGRLPDNYGRQHWGGTNPSVVFEWIDAQRMGHVDCLVVFSDFYFGRHEVPESFPTYPILWVAEPQSNLGILDSIEYGKKLHIEDYD